MEKSYFSILDSERFGFKVAKINDYGTNPKKTLNDLRNSDYKLVISKINAEEICFINELENFGFRIMDTQVTYKYDLSKLNKNPLYDQKSNVNIRICESKDIEAIVKIAEESFKNYGHYSADNNLDKVKCLEIYKDWAFKSCTDNNVADKVFVAEIGNEVVGFLSFKKFSVSGVNCAAGGLGAILKDFRGLDIFKKITVKGLEWGVEQKLAWEEHNVLINNYPVNSSFSKMGFTIWKSFYTLHCWLNKQ
jgi:hypothetical protein